MRSVPDDERRRPVMSRLEHQNRTDPAAAFEDLFEDDGWDDFPSNYLKLVAYLR